MSLPTLKGLVQEIVFLKSNTLQYLLAKKKAVRYKAKKPIKILAPTDLLKEDERKNCFHSSERKCEIINC